jgi:hypothetical protein
VPSWGRAIEYCTALITDLEAIAPISVLLVDQVDPGALRGCMPLTRWWCNSG